MWGGAGCNHMCASITRAHRDTGLQSRAHAKYISVLPARPVGAAWLQRGAVSVFSGVQSRRKTSGDGGDGGTG